MIGLDEKTKGHMESFLDNMVEKGDLLAVLGWVREETSISSFRDLALGYMIGGAVVGSSLLASLSEKKDVLSHATFSRPQEPVRYQNVGFPPRKIFR